MVVVLPVPLTPTTSDHERHAALVDLDLAIARGVLQQFDHLVAQRFPRAGRLRDTLPLDAGAQVLHKFQRCIDAKIGLDQQHLEIFEEFLGDFASIKEIGDIFEDPSPGLLEPLFNFWFWFGLPAKEPTEYHDNVLTAGGLLPRTIESPRRNGTARRIKSIHDARNSSQIGLRPTVVASVVTAAVSSEQRRTCRGAGLLRRTFRCGIVPADPSIEG